MLGPPWERRTIITERWLVHYAVLCPIWTNHPEGNKALYTMISLGAITAVLALISLAIPERVSFEGLIALMGLLFVVSPWVMGFGTGFTAFAWTAWIVGAVSLVAGAADVQVTRTAHRGHGMVTG